MDSLVYSSKFKVRGHDVNIHKKMTIPSLLRNMQEASLQHARILNTSAWDMEDDKITWVLIRKEIKFLHPLNLDETYTILTYPSGFEKFFAYRDYLIFDQNKKLVVGASSTWTLIQTEERKLMKIPEKILEIGAPKNTRFLPQPEKILKLPMDLEVKDLRKVRAYDLDWNNHVNNIVLIRYIMESIKQNGIEDDQINKLIVHFKNELHLHQGVKVKQATDKNEIFSALLEEESGKEIARSKVYVRVS